ncbi:MAG: hypothetical protein Kow0059_10640 [Candidatus Sumerlaeia bacterium]
MTTGRIKLARCLAFEPTLALPRFENNFHEDIEALWHRQGLPADRSLQDYFQFDRREELPVQWRPSGKPPFVISTPAALAEFRHAYDPRRPPPLPRDWIARLAAWKERHHVLFASPWDEGLLQTIGVRDDATFRAAMVLMAENPALAAETMALYADALVAWLEPVLEQVVFDYAVFYEPIASNHAPVISPDLYRRVTLPALRRVCAALETRAVNYRFMWSSGQIVALIPHWLEAGINGLHVAQRRRSGISYVQLRREFGRDLRFFGGVDSGALARGPADVAHELKTHVRPLLEQGGYVPYLDDRIRPPVTFAAFCDYRRQLDALIRSVYSA